MSNRTVHARITGRVQGVFYRDWTVGEARSRGLRGWVRNRADGSVEAVFSGEASAVDGMIEACRSGPRAAVVEELETHAADEADIPSGFEKRPTV